jgi:hypothetical protein
LRALDESRLAIPAAQPQRDGGERTAGSPLTTFGFGHETREPFALI